MNPIHTRSTKTFRAVEANMILVECCEPDCQMTFLTEKSETGQDEKHRCVCCVMKTKIKTMPRSR